MLCFSGILELPQLPFHCEKHFIYLFCIRIPHWDVSQQWCFNIWVGPDNILLWDCPVHCSMLGNLKSIWTETIKAVLRHPSEWRTNPPHLRTTGPEEGQPVLASILSVMCLRENLLGRPFSLSGSTLGHSPILEPVTGKGSIMSFRPIPPWLRKSRKGNKGQAV